MGKADLSRLQCLHALPQLRRHPADGDPVGGGFLREVTVEAHPVDGGVEALVVEVVGLRELSRELGDLEQQEVALTLLGDQFLGQLGLPRNHLEHAQILPN